MLNQVLNSLVRSLIQAVGVDFPFVALACASLQRTLLLYQFFPSKTSSSVLALIFPERCDM